MTNNDKAEEDEDKGGAPVLNLTTRRATRVSSLEKLLAFKYGSHLTIKLYDPQPWLYGGIWPPRHDHVRRRAEIFGGILKIIFPILSRLKEAGYQLELILEKYRFSPKDGIFSVEGWLENLKQVRAHWRHYASLIRILIISQHENRSIQELNSSEDDQSS